MKTQKVKTVNAFTYREGYGTLPVVDAAPNSPLPKYKPLYYTTRLLGSNEELDVTVDGPFVFYREPVQAAPARIRPSYVARKRKR